MNALLTKFRWGSRMTRWIGLALCGWQLAGCVELAEGPPRLREVCLAEEEQGCVQQGLAGEDLALVLRGQNPGASFVVDLGNRDPIPTADGKGIRAWIGDQELTGLVLSEGDAPGGFVLTGTLPGRLALGYHDAILQTPSGLAAELREAFLVQDPFVIRKVTTDAPEFPVGYTTILSVTLENQGRSAITDIELGLTQQGTGRCLLPSLPAAFTLGAGESRAIDLGLRAVEAGTLSVFVTAAGRANGVVEVGPGTLNPSEKALSILGPAQLKVTAAIAPASLAVLQVFEVTVEVENTGGTPALDVRLLAPTLAGSGAAEMESPPATRLDLPPNAKQQVQWGGRALGPGTVQISARATGEEAISGRPLGPVESEPVELTIQ
jgi:hypothetical protein